MIYNDSAPVDFAAAGEHQFDRFGVNAVFLDEDARAQRIGCVVVEHGYNGLPDNGAVVESAGDEVNRRAAEFNAVFQRSRLDVEAWKRGQQCGMNVQDGIGKRVSQDTADDSHETGQHDQSGVASIQGRHQLGIELFSNAFPRWKKQRLQTAAPCAFQAGSIFDIADDDGDRRVQSAR